MLQTSSQPIIGTSFAVGTALITPVAPHLGIADLLSQSTMNPSNVALLGIESDALAYHFDPNRRIRYHLAW
jgi:hypothetical protein